MFPNAYSTVYYNEAGEPLGWTDESNYEPDYDPFGGLRPEDFEDDCDVEGCEETGEWEAVFGVYRCADHRTQCNWFALCDNAATRLREHSLLGHVPICDRCNTRMDEIS